MKPHADRRSKPTARRPLLGERGGKRGLSNVGGPVESSGDPDLSRAMAAAFAVRAGERDATLTHPFHAYPARLHPEVARELVALVGSHAKDRSSTILDPCCGSGTVVIESAVAGHRAIGSDLSPLGVELAKMKSRMTGEAERKAMVEAAHAISREAAAIVRAGRREAVPRGEHKWFTPHTLAEVAALASRIDALAPGFVRAACRMLLSSILVKVSKQASDTDARPISAPVPAGAALHFFARKSLELDRCLAAFAAAVPKGTSLSDVHLDDALVLSAIPDGSVDAVITSPPYANTYDYVTHHERRYAWLGLNATALASHEIGAARWFEVPEIGVVRFARELTGMCTAMGRVLRPGGFAFIVTADGAAGDRPLFADEGLTAAVRTTDLAVVARVSQARPTFDKASSQAFARRPKREHLIALVRK